MWGDDYTVAAFVASIGLFIGLLIADVQPAWLWFVGIATTIFGYLWRERPWLG